MKRIARMTILLLLALPLLAGCATSLATGARFDGHGDDAGYKPEEILLYPATTLDVLGFGLFCCTNFIEIEGERSAVDHVYSRTVFPLACLIDLPFSLVSDTLFLPYDIYTHLSADRFEAGPPDPSSTDGEHIAARPEEKEVKARTNPTVQGR